MNSRFEALRYEYEDFIRRKNAMMDRISNVLDGVNEYLIYEPESMTDDERQELEKMQERLEEIYESLEEVVIW